MDVALTAQPSPGSSDADAVVSRGPSATCHGCGTTIKDRWLLQAVDRAWHETCLRCSYCHCVLADVGTTLFARADLLLCRRDYLRLFGTSGICSYCEQVIAACDMVMRAKEHVYHLECFACFKCQHRFCIGDRYYLLGVRILCEPDYEEHLRQFANDAQRPPCNGGVQQQQQQQQAGASAAFQPRDAETTASPMTSPWYHQGGQALVPRGRRLQIGTDNHRTLPHVGLLDDRSSGYGSPSPPCV